MYSRLTIQCNRYVDSVTLMQIRGKAMQISGAVYAEIQMATPANIDILRELGFEVPKDAGPNDLVIGITADSDENAEKILRRVMEMLEHRNVSDEQSCGSLEEIDFEESGYNLVQVSLPGEYAAAEAEKVIEKGCDVFIFSDNVPLEKELALKRKGQEKGCLVMGPDCGVGLINGVALGAGSIVREGEIGIVGASGSGAQEVACIIEKCGFGVSQIIGTGGRDLYPQIGGLAMTEGIRRLEDEKKTKVIVLVSKLADSSVMKKVLDFADEMTKPVAAVFLGGDKALFEGHRVKGAESLEEAAEIAVKMLTGENHTCGYSDIELAEIAGREIKKLSSQQKYFRGLYCGGTFAEESMIYFRRNVKEIQIYTNLENRYSIKLKNPEISLKNTILDLGAEDFTEKFPHPVFDSALRLKRLRKELEDKEVAVVMLDFITGPGVDEDPITDIAYVCREVNAGERHVIFVSAICGSEEDPQDTAGKAALLRECGVIVTGSNYQSAKLVGIIMAELEKRG